MKKQRDDCSSVISGIKSAVEVDREDNSHVEPSLTIVMGVSGSGKSTFAKWLAKQTQSQFIEADDFHSEASKEMMSAGEALTEKERAPWIANMLNFFQSHLQKKLNDNNSNNFQKSPSYVLAYSGLKANHRNMFSQLPCKVTFYHMEVSKAELERRLKRRASSSSHFMSAKLLQSQLDALEPFEQDRQEVITIDANNSITNIKQQLMAIHTNRNRFEHGGI